MTFALRKTCKFILPRQFVQVYKGILTGALFLLAASFPLPGQVKCGLSPGLVMTDFKPGTPLEVTLEVSNASSAPMSMRGVAMDYWYDRENKKVFAPPGTMPHSAGSWIEFVP